MKHDHASFWVSKDKKTTAFDEIDRHYRTLQDVLAKKLDALIEEIGNENGITAKAKNAALETLRISLIKTHQAGSVYAYDHVLWALQQSVNEGESDFFGQELLQADKTLLKKVLDVYTEIKELNTEYQSVRDDKFEVEYGNRPER